MVALNIKAFRGKVPRLSNRLLAGNFAVEALNCKLQSGRLDPLKGPALVHTSDISGAIATLFRYRNDGVDNWLVWNRRVDAQRSPTANDSRNRLFYTGDGEPRMTTNADAIAGGGPYPDAWFVLGVYVPITAPTAGTTGGSGAQETRSYVFTFKTPYGEESAPSPAVTVTGFSNATSWNLTGLEAVPPNSGTVTAASTVSTGIVEVTLDTVRGLSVHEEATFASVGGMTSLNATHRLIAVDPGTNKVRVALTTAQTYTSGGTWARRAPHNTTGMKRVIYRTVGTNTDYKRVAEISAAGATYDDTVAGTALGDPITTLESDPPPKDLHSLIALANGALAGLSGNQLCISEQYKPHSWPQANRYAFSGTGVALCAAGNSAIVLTDGYPIVATCAVPDAASLARLPTYAPCVAKAGVVDLGGKCLFPSHDGLYGCTPNDAANVTEDLFSYDEWQALMPATFKAAYFDQRYYAMHDGAGERQALILVLDITQPDSVAEVDEQVDTLFSNQYDGKLYVAIGNKVYEWDADAGNSYLAFWQSKDFQLSAPVNFSCAQVHARFGDIVPIDTTLLNANQALLASANNILGALGSTEGAVVPLGASNLLDVGGQSEKKVQFTLLADGQAVFTKQVFSSQPFRLPAGFKSELQAIQLSTSIQVFGATVAQGMDELRQTSS